MQLDFSEVLQSQKELLKIMWNEIPRGKNGVTLLVPYTNFGVQNISMLSSISAKRQIVYKDVFVCRY